MATWENLTGYSSEYSLSIGTSIDPIGLFFPEICSTYWYHTITCWKGGGGGRFFQNFMFAYTKKFHVRPLNLETRKRLKKLWHIKRSSFLNQFKGTKKEKKILSLLKIDQFLAQYETKPTKKNVSIEYMRYRRKMRWGVVEVAGGGVNICQQKTLATQTRAKQLGRNKLGKLFFLLLMSVFYCFH